MRSIAVAIAALCWGAVGGAVLNLLHVPLAWMLGSLSFAAGASLLLPALRIHSHVRYIGQLAVGASVGLGFKAAVIAALLALLPVMFLITALTIVLAIAMSYAFARLARIDSTTAFFASMPGGVAEMVTLAERHGGNPMLVSLSQSLRIFITVASVPLLVSLIHPVSTSGLVAPPGSWTVLGVCLIFAVALLAALGIGLMRIPNAWLLGGILAGGIFANVDMSVVQMPTIIVIVAQVMIGTSLGLRFKRGAGVGMRMYPQSLTILACSSSRFPISAIRASPSTWAMDRVQKDRWAPTHWCARLSPTPLIAKRSIRSFSKASI